MEPAFHARFLVASRSILHTYGAKESSAFRHALAAVKSHCFRYWSMRKARWAEKHDSANRALLHAYNTYIGTHVTCVYTMCYERSTCGVATSLHNPLCTPFRATRLAASSVVFYTLFSSAFPLSSQFAITSYSLEREHENTRIQMHIRTHSASLAPFY